MTTVIGFDYTDRIDPAALKAAGCQVVFRYLSQPGWPKNLTKTEAGELLAAGIAIVLNYETTAAFMLAGYAGGVAAARSARAQASALGAPGVTRIYYSADFDATAAQIPAVMDFVRGAVAVDGAAEVDEYGGLRIVQAAAAVGMRPWQTLAWSGGVWDPRDVARQTGKQRVVGGVQVDVNMIMDLSALGAWMPAGSSPAPSPTTTSSGSDVNLTDVLGPVSAGMAAIAPDAGTEQMGAGATYTVGAALLGTAERSAETLILVKRLAAGNDPAGLASAIVAAIVPHLPAALDQGAFTAAVVAAVQSHAPGTVDLDALAALVVSHLAAALVKA